MAPPIVLATVQSAVLNAISNVVGQLITRWQAQKPLALDLGDFARFVLFTTLTCPPNYIWQAFLEAQFPGFAPTLSPIEKEKLVDETVTGKSSAREPGSQDAALAKRHVSEKETSTQSKPVTTMSGKQNPGLNWTNTAIKFALDQTFGAGVNTALFIVSMGLLQGNSWHIISTEFSDQFWPMIFAGQKFWPLISILSFTAVPVERRMLFGATAGLFWGAYLSMLTSGG